DLGEQLEEHAAEVVLRAVCPLGQLQGRRVEQRGQQRLVVAVGVVEDLRGARGGHRRHSIGTTACWRPGWPASMYSTRSSSTPGSDSITFTSWGSTRGSNRSIALTIWCLASATRPSSRCSWRSWVTPPPYSR